MGKTTGKPRAVTLRDAREGNFVPSVTTILKLLHKQGLVDWMIEQAVLACLTTPRKEGEEMDAFVERVLHTEKVQDQESAVARDKGTEIHGALEDYFMGVDVDKDLLPWITPAAEAIQKYGELVATEKILVGDGYAGKTDLIQEATACWWLWDYKTTKKLPDPAKGGAWMEHRLQLAAYAQAYRDMLPPQTKGIRTANVYISSIEQGKFVICENPPWESAYNEGFAPLITHWQWANNYRPKIETKAWDGPTPIPEAPAKPEATTLKGRRVVWTPATAARTPMPPQ